MRLAVHDLLGREVAVLADGRVAAGHHTALLGGRNLATGVYVVRLVVGPHAFAQHITLGR